MTGRGVRAMVVRMPQVHDRTKQGFASYLLDHAREKGSSDYVGEGLNRWPAVHRLDAARLYRLVLEKGAAGERYHAVAGEGVSDSHFGWLDRIAQMDVPASSRLTQQKLGWHSKEKTSFLADLEYLSLVPSGVDPPYARLIGHSWLLALRHGCSSDRCRFLV